MKTCKIILLPFCLIAIGCTNRGRNMEILKSWFDAGAFCVGMGSKLITSDFVREEKYDLFQERAKEIVQMVEKTRA